MTDYKDLKLKTDPIVEALFEIRFRKSDAMPSSALAGLVFSAYREQYPHFENLPASNVPQEVRDRDESFHYKATHRISGDGYAISVGDRVCSLSGRRPYKHWEDFKERILGLIEALKQFNVIEVVDRISLRYINFFESEEVFPDHYKYIDFSCNLASKKLEEYPTTVKTQIPVGNCKNIIQIVPGASVSVPPDVSETNGLVFDIDSIMDGPFEDFWSKVDGYLDDIHRTEKQIFFESLSELAKEHFGLAE
ncbi:uncharacterized protein (TIGR04255 family) [Halospina denitrificans]|uniref:Uncharacterized protein (TIGR04255 family) n=1 Tax=Halospina denitrificans TaxID=332522 RepID=A0A4R7K0V9_9GAMM|nr:TIGR04255 family protein [Halospina denitrificans]TDT43597.1 uncharacterized protein (TIGR04255 family) [Halospina denitrificans]